MQTQDCNPNNASSFVLSPRVHWFCWGTAWVSFLYLLICPVTLLLKLPLMLCWLWGFIRLRQWLRRTAQLTSFRAEGGWVKLSFCGAAEDPYDVIEGAWLWRGVIVVPLRLQSPAFETKPGLKTATIKERVHCWLRNKDSSGRVLSITLVITSDVYSEALCRGWRAWLLTCADTRAKQAARADK